jgi:hypothetical protein
VERDVVFCKACKHVKESAIRRYDNFIPSLNMTLTRREFGYLVHVAFSEENCPWFQRECRHKTLGIDLDIRPSHRQPIPERRS